MLVLVLLGSLLAVSNAAKVLIMPSTLYPVHPYTMKFLADELVRRGHEVTWVEYGPVESSTTLNSNVKRIFWKVSYEDDTLHDVFVDRTHVTHEMIWDAGFDLRNEQTTAWLASIRLCDKVLKNHKPQFDALVKEKFDTVIVDDLYNPCGLLQTGLKGSVFIYWSITGLRTESAWANQSPSPPSYLPVAGTKLTEDMTFIERSYNLAYYLKALYIHQHIVLPRMDAVFQKYYPGVDSAFNLERNASINFVNMPPIFDFARPYMPRVNFVGGLHCRNATKITDSKLAAFVDGASEKDGFVVLSTGFTAQWKLSSQELKNLFSNVMEKHENTRFVWQFDGHPTSVPELKNVFIQKWLPLQDLLGHPKCKAHVTHGGLNSVIESVYHGVPIVGIPLTVQGHDNILRVSARKAGIILTKYDLNEESLSQALSEIRDKKYKEEMLVFQDMVRDVPFTELEHAAFWVEFIERHQEVPHARSGADKLNIFQYFLVDVIVFLLSIIMVFLAVAIFVIRITLRIILWPFKKTQKPKVSEKKKKN